MEDDVVEEEVALGEGGDVSGLVEVSDEGGEAAETYGVFQGYHAVED